MPQSVAAPSSPDLIRALWVNPAPPGKEPASASTAGGKPLSSPAGGEEKEVDPMLEPEDTTACDFLPHSPLSMSYLEEPVLNNPFTPSADGRQQSTMAGKTMFDS
jgi:hypothetical protein